ncbi:response regulator [Rubrivirga sp. IMCC43871]|uniref:response regulator transcription factor n=1 Tax=Rubrivirga sp. IMCC43871 TaxID=3391575 RepID=UPI00398FB759
MSREITLVVADDHPALRAGLARLLDAQPGITVIGQADGGEEALQMVRERTPDVLLLDIDMPDLSGVHVARALRDEGHPVRVLAFTAHAGRQFVEGLLDAGAAGYLTKDRSMPQIVEAIQGVARGEGRWFVAPGPVSEALGALTPREREVLIALAEGRSNAEIAATLHLSESTVRNHLTRVYATLGVESAREAVAWAWRHGVAGPNA